MHVQTSWTEASQHEGADGSGHSGRARPLPVPRAHLQRKLTPSRAACSSTAEPDPLQGSMLVHSGSRPPPGQRACLRQQHRAICPCDTRSFAPRCPHAKGKCWRAQAPPIQSLPCPGTHHLQRPRGASCHPRACLRGGPASWVPAVGPAGHPGQPLCAWGPLLRPEAISPPRMGSVPVELCWLGSQFPQGSPGFNPLSLEVLGEGSFGFVIFTHKEQALLCRKPRSLCVMPVCALGTLPACPWARSTDGIAVQCAVDCPVLDTVLQ